MPMVVGQLGIGAAVRRWALPAIGSGGLALALLAYAIARTTPSPLADVVLALGLLLIALLVSMRLRERNEAQLREAQNLAAIGAVTGGVAHDFNNLLGVMIGNLDLLLESEDAVGEVIELAREARGAALRGADLANRLLDKPYRKDQLARALREVIERGNEPG